MTTTIEAGNLSVKNKIKNTLKKETKATVLNSAFLSSMIDTCNSNSLISYSYLQQ
jgi:hypothetical protein